MKTLFKSSSARPASKGKLRAREDTRITRIRAGEESASTSFQKVLVPIDLSQVSIEGLRYAVRMTNQFGSSIWLVYIQQPASFVNGIDVPLAMSDEEACKEAHKLLERFLREEVEPSRRGGALVRLGMPGHEIAKAARVLGIDLIVMTTRGYSGVKRLFYPSIAEQVARKACCPVLTVNRVMLEKKNVARIPQAAHRE